MYFHGKIMFVHGEITHSNPIVVTCHGEIAIVPGKRFLVGGLNPSQKYESQLG